jgi:hypothetical protein
MLKKITIHWLVLSSLVVICGCNKTESQSEFQERQKVHAEIDSALEAVHASIFKIGEASQSFDLVSQPLSESSSPENIVVEREWVLSSTGHSHTEDSKASVIESSESVLKKHVTSAIENLDYDSNVKDEGDRIRIRAKAIWNRTPK